MNDKMERRSVPEGTDRHPQMEPKPATSGQEITGHLQHSNPVRRRALMDAVRRTLLVRRRSRALRMMHRDRAGREYAGELHRRATAANRLPPVRFGGGALHDRDPWLCSPSCPCSARRRSA